METLSVPTYILGKSVYEGMGLEKEIGKYDTVWGKLKLEVTYLSPMEEGQRRLEKICEGLIKNHEEIKKIPQKEISDIIENMGRDFPKREEYRELINTLSIIYNRSPQVIRQGVNKVVKNLVKNKEFIKSDLGGYDTEEWDSKGFIFHNLPGNTPLIGISIPLSKICKNIDFGKTGRDDPLTVIKFCEVLGEEDKRLGKTIAALYFPSTVNGEINPAYHIIADHIRNYGGALVAYGGPDAIATLKKISKDIEMIVHGPEKSIIVVDEYKDNIGEKIVKDIIPDEQESCVNPSFVLVKSGLGEKICEDMAKAFIKYTEKFPPTPISIPELEGKRNKYIFEKDMELYTSSYILKKLGKPKEEQYWTIAYAKKPIEFSSFNEMLEVLFNDTIRRFIIVMEYKNEEEIINWIENSNMKEFISKVGIEGNCETLRNYIKPENLPFATTSELGGITSIIPGEPHDGIHELQAFSKPKRLNKYA